MSIAWFFFCIGCFLLIIFLYWHEAYFQKGYALNNLNRKDEAIKFYEVLMGKTNHNFGLIGYEDLNPLRHYIDERYHFLGGSPDGIALDNKGIEKPIMIEVKCPFRRKIVHGKIPEHYYAQLQLNLAICNLDIADLDRKSVV